MDIQWNWTFLPSIKCLSLTISPCEPSRKSNWHVLTLDNSQIMSTNINEAMTGLGFVPGPVEIKVLANGEPRCKFIQDSLILSWSDASIAHAQSDSYHAMEGIECQGCGQEIVTHPVTFKSLPSDYWYELVDFWSCHRQEFAAVSERLPSVLVPPTFRTIYYSDDHAYIVVRYNDMMTKCGDHVSCVKCGYKLGWLIDKQGVQIPYYRCQRVSVEASLFMHILSCINAHSTYLYTLHDGHDRLPFRVVNWQCLIGKDTLQPGIIVELMPSSEANEEVQLFTSDFEQINKLLQDRQGILGQYSYLTKS